MPPTSVLSLPSRTFRQAPIRAGLIALAWLIPLAAWGQPADALALQAKLREECDKFELLPQTTDATGKAVLQYVDSTKNFYLDGTHRFFGFRFKAPDDVERSGSFCWMFLLRNQHERITISQLDWNILPRKEGWRGFTNFFTRKTSEYPELAAQFPNTNTVFIQYQQSEYFRPGEEYIIFFRIPLTDKPPEIALAFTFLEAGQREGVRKLPLDSKYSPPKQMTSYEGDPW